MKPTFKRTELSRSIRSALVGSGAIVALTAGGSAIGAEPGGSDPANLDALKEQVRALMGRIDELEDQQAASEQQVEERLTKIQEQEEAETVPANVVTSGDIPGSFRIPGSNTSVSLTGYVKGDAIYDLDGDVGDSFALSAAPLEDAEDQENVRLHGRQSRVIIQSETALENDTTISTHIEGDFFGTGGTESFSNSTSFRIRHAYGEWGTSAGTFLAGQTWTLFGGFNYARTIDFFGPNGQVFIRQGQFRYTLPNGLAFSLENPETLIMTGALGDEDPDTGVPVVNVSNFGDNEEQDELPDFVAKWSGGPGGVAGTYNISGVARQLGGSGTGVDGEAYDDEEFAWGVHVGGTWDFEVVALTAGVAYGEALGRYHLSNTSVGAVAVNGGIETLDQLGATAGLTIPTGSTGSFNFTLGYSERDDEFAAFMPELDEKGVTLHSNYIWTPWAGSSFGAEVIYGKREQFNGEDGRNIRFQLAAQQNF